MRVASIFPNGKIVPKRGFVLVLGRNSEGYSIELRFVDGHPGPECVGRSFVPRLRANLPLASDIEPLVFAL